MPLPLTLRVSSSHFMCMCMHVLLMNVGALHAKDLYGSWEPNPGPLEEHPVLLTGEPSLQSESLILSIFSFSVPEAL